MTKKNAPHHLPDLERFSLSATARSYPKLPYQKIKDVILGPHYSLSLVFLGEVRAQKLNMESRGKTYVPNVLSFPLTESTGEIYITPQVAKHEAQSFAHSYRQHVVYLYIHGLLHLKGYEHGEAMEELEKRYLKKFNFK